MSQETPRLTIAHQSKPAGFGHLLVDGDWVWIQSFPSKSRMAVVVELFLRRPETLHVKLFIACGCANSIEILVVVHVLVRGWKPALGVIDRVCLAIDVAMELIDVGSIVVFCNV